MQIGNKCFEVSLEDRNKYYFYIKKFLKKNFIGTQHEWESHIKNIFSIFEKNLKSFHPKNMLDVGCGEGDRTIRIADYFNIPSDKIYAVDYNKRHLLECRKRFNATEADLEIDDLPFKSNNFDLVVCNQVLEHLKGYKKAIDDIVRVTNIKGYIVPGIPNLAHLINRFIFLAGIQPMCIRLDGHHVRGFTHKAFVDLLNSYKNIELIDYRGALMYPFPFLFSKILAILFCGMSGYICYLLRKKY